MRQLVLPDEYGGEPEVELTGEDAHYLLRVLRLSVDDSVPGIDRDGNAYHLTLTEADRERCVLRVQRKGRADLEEPQITLYQALPKGRKLDDIIRRCTEAGVHTIVPLHTRYSIPQPDDRAIRTRHERWKRIATEAVQQSGAPRVPEIELPRSFSELPAFSKRQDELGLFFHQEPLAEGALHGYLYARPDRISLVVGPEGGLSDKEVDSLSDHGYHAAYLGPRVLRTETAALYAIAAIQVIMMELDSWMPS